LLLENLLQFTQSNTGKFLECFHLHLVPGLVHIPLHSEKEIHSAFVGTHSEYAEKKNSVLLGYGCSNSDGLNGDLLRVGMGLATLTSILDRDIDVWTNYPELQIIDPLGSHKAAVLFVRSNDKSLVR
jgi:hypothetical protein